MKQLIILLLIPVLSMAQPSGYPVTDTLFKLADKTGTDTALYLNFFDAKHNSIEFEYFNLNCDSVTIDVGYSNFGYTFNSADESLFPLTLNVTANKYALPGKDSAASFAVSKYGWELKYIVAKLYMPTTCTAGFIRYSFIK